MKAQGPQLVESPVSLRVLRKKALRPSLLQEEGLFQNQRKKPFSKRLSSSLEELRALEGTAFSGALRKKALGPFLLLQKAQRGMPKALVQAL